jgi:hypothetical protein
MQSRNTLRQFAVSIRSARLHTAVSTLVAAYALAACTGGPSPLPKLPGAAPMSGLPQLPIGSIGLEPGSVQAGSTEVYARIARGANACWFGTRGRLAKSHVFFADADPSASGGKVEIIVHERALDQPRPWGFKAFRIVLSETQAFDGSSGGNTSIEVENVRMPDDEAALMRREVLQWATGVEGCSLATGLRAVSNPPAPNGPELKPAAARR